MVNLNNSDLDTMYHLVIPSGRHVRVTLSALVSMDEDQDTYFESINSDVELDRCYNVIILLSIFKEPMNE
jgi:hypothetical protein